MKKRKVMLLIAGVMFLACIGGGCEGIFRGKGNGGTMAGEKEAEKNFREENTQADSFGEKIPEGNQRKTDFESVDSQNNLSGTVPAELECRN